jgi:flagellar biosynthesis protein FliQ
MTGAEILDVAKDSIWVLLMVSAPVMIIGLVVGIAISLVQALTQVQEATLTFVPKMVAMFAGFVIFLPFMSSSMMGLMERIALKIATIE